jgi:hypothetical protein
VCCEEIRETDFVCNSADRCIGDFTGHAQSGFLPVQGLTAYDSVGKRIGNVVGFSAAGFNSFPSVAFFKDNTTVVLEVGGNRLFGSFDLLYTSTDCTGTPFLAIASWPGWTLTPNALRDGAVYVPDTSAPPPSLPLAVMSFFTDKSEVPECQEAAFEFPDAVQAKNLGDLPTFTRPFSVR